MDKFQLPRNALSKVIVGQSFAEYDLLSEDPSIFVHTPASNSLTQGDKCFFVGRRGSGKTAIVTQAKRIWENGCIELVPQIFDLLKLPLDFGEFKDTRQRPFKSLSHCFERAILDEAIRSLVHAGKISFENIGDEIRKERNLIMDCDFDSRVMNLTEEIFEAYSTKNDKLWLRQINRSKKFSQILIDLNVDRSFSRVILIDRLDESWDGSDTALISLMALMHACMRIAAAIKFIRPCVFIRENIFEKIKARDNEFSRLESSVVHLEWSESKLIEVVERRFVKPFGTKPKLGGQAWDCFFQEDSSYSAKLQIFTTCQKRPRDLLMFCGFAVESAVNNNHQIISREDVDISLQRYSLSRLKDLSDEFDENYPNVHLIMGYFFGLSTEYTLSAIENFLQRLLVDNKISTHCGSWFFSHSTPSQFIELFYNIGFFGVKDNGKEKYKGIGSDPSTSPKVDQNSTIIIHPTYRHALHLRDMLLSSLSSDIKLRYEGILEDLPNGITFDNYKTEVLSTLEALKSLPQGPGHAGEFENIIGRVIGLCFFRALTNLEEKFRTHDGKTIKDWIASNRAIDGFWGMIKTKYGATQIIWECKNYDDLNADDFHQACYYMNDVMGKFCVLVFRGQEITKSYFTHMDRSLSKQNNGLILVLRQKDIEVFLRQASSGKVKESHLHELFDLTVRSIS